MIATIHQPQFLPWLGYFDKADKAGIFILLDNVQFKKNEWQNRNRIRTSQGWQWLTVPVIHSFGQKINEVKINNKTKWKESHLKALELNYKNAPYYKDYIAFFKEAYAKEWGHLSDINVFFIKKIIEWLGIKCKLIMSSECDTREDSTERLIDLCLNEDAHTYISGIDGAKYLDYEKFESSGIEIITQNFEHPVYNQLWTKNKEDNFISHMSVIDLIFNYGPQSLEIIRKSGVKNENSN